MRCSLPGPAILPGRNRAIGDRGIGDRASELAVLVYVYVYVCVYV